MSFLWRFLKICKNFNFFQKLKAIFHHFWRFYMYKKMANDKSTIQLQNDQISQKSTENFKSYNKKSEKIQTSSEPSQSQVI